MKKQILLLGSLFSLLCLVNQSVATEGIYDPCTYKKGREKCECYAAQAKSFESKMRAGYSAQEYNNLEANRRYFNDKAFHCKNR